MYRRVHKVRLRQGACIRKVQRMKRAIAIVSGALLLTACGSAATTAQPTATATATVQQTTAAPTEAPAPPTTAVSPAPMTPAASPSATDCALPNDVEYLERDIVPRLLPSAIRVGAVNGALCKTTVDALPLISPLGDGYCTQLALASDNPGYDENATPAAPLRKVVAQVGGSC